MYTEVIIIIIINYSDQYFESFIIIIIIISFIFSTGINLVYYLCVTGEAFGFIILLFVIIGTICWGSVV